MSLRNVELLRRCAESLNVGDTDAVIGMYSPDVTVEFRDDAGARSQDVLLGPGAIRRIVEHWSAPYDEFGAEVIDYVDADPWVICDTRLRTGDAAGGARAARFADAYEVQGGLIVRAVLGYTDVAAAAADVGTAPGDAQR